MARLIISRIYADLDLECLRPFDTLFLRQIAYSLSSTHPESQSSLPSLYQFAYFGRLSGDFNFQESISNAWMASTTNHPFFLLPIEAINHHSADSTQYQEWAEQLSGRQALSRLIEWYEAGYDRGRDLVWHLQSPSLNRIMFETFNVQHSITVLPSGVIFPGLGQSSSASEFGGFTRKMHLKTGSL